jgi:uncharacterized protein
MKLESDPGSGIRNRISGYGSGHVIVAGIRHERNVIITAEEVVSGWGPTASEALSDAHMEALADFAPEIVLVGTGSRLQFPRHGIMECLTRRGIGVEFMDTRAACRAFNYLAGEDRRVLAALIIP